ncbi:MAG: hypothetical protein JKX81_04595 [Arenicella sp.]|nr:hypothetical protein [Arenicella sp.]
MTYLFFQIWLWILASFALGWVAHWFLCCRGKNTPESDVDFGGSDKSSNTNKQSSSAVTASESSTIDA